MLIYPAIDIIGGKAVRLFKGDYAQKTVYGDPASVAQDFKAQGAGQIHVVDLDGAKSGLTPNFSIIEKIKKETGLFVEVGGGIRSTDVVEKYLSVGIDRVILGTAAVENEEFLIDSLKRFSDKIAVGVDLKDGFIAVKGWTETSKIPADLFLSKLEKLGVNAVICTDISKDGAMKGPNFQLYETLVERYKFKVIASGGVSSIYDVAALKRSGVYGAIVGKAYYTGAVDLGAAIEVAK